MITYKVNILEELKKAGYNQGRIRREKLMNTSAIDKLRAGTTDISLKTVDTICTLLHAEPGDILTAGNGQTTVTEWTPEDEERIFRFNETEILEKMKYNQKESAIMLDSIYTLAEKLMENGILDPSCYRTTFEAVRQEIASCIRMKREFDCETLNILLRCAEKKLQKPESIEKSFEKLEICTFLSLVFKMLLENEVAPEKRVEIADFIEKCGCRNSAMQEKKQELLAGLGDAPEESEAEEQEEQPETMPQNWSIPEIEEDFGKFEDVLGDAPEEPEVKEQEEQPETMPQNEEKEKCFTVETNDCEKVLEITKYGENGIKLIEAIPCEKIVSGGGKFSMPKVKQVYKSNNPLIVVKNGTSNVSIQCKEVYMENISESSFVCGETHSIKDTLKYTGFRWNRNLQAWVSTKKEMSVKDRALIAPKLKPCTVSKDDEDYAALTGKHELGDFKPMKKIALID